MATERRSEAIWIETRERWQIKVQKNGDRKCFTSKIPGRKGKHDAEAQADAWLKERTRDMRFPAAWQLFLEDQQDRTGSANYAKHESYGRLYLLPVIGNKKLSSLTPTLWQSCINAAAKHGLARRSLKNIISSISAFLHFAKRARLDVEPLEDGDVTIPQSAEPEKPKTILQPEHVRTLFRDDTIIKYGKPVRAHYIYAWRFFVLTGLRRGELCGLKWSDVHGNQIHIARSINAFGEETHGKNDNARRTIILAPIMFETLDAQRQHLKDLGLVSPWVFPDEYGERSVPKSIADRWATYCNQHGFKTTIHELRHTFISLNKSDLPLELMKSVVGHSTSMDTYGVYGHDVDGDSARAASIIETVFDRILE